MSRNIKKYLEKHNNSRQICSICGRSIPKYIQRVSLSYSSKFGCSYKRICSLCILELSKELDLKSIEEWKDKMMVEEL